MVPAEPPATEATQLMVAEPLVILVTGVTAAVGVAAQVTCPVALLFKEAEYFGPPEQLVLLYANT